MTPNATYHPIISPTDALWALYQSQTKQVRKAFRSRFFAETALEKKAAEIAGYEHGLTEQERQAVYDLVGAIKKGIADVDHAVANKTHVGHKAEDFLYELKAERI